MRKVPPINDAGHGYDRFGLSGRALALASTLGWPLYKLYFRVESDGLEHIPAKGPALLIGNHSGSIPIDAMMVSQDVLVRTGRPLRPIVDHFASALPFAGLLMQRVGAVGGAMENVLALLRAKERVLIFPEGVPGISKPRERRYRLSTWRVGHAEVALRCRIPVIPFAVIGAEEQLPILFNARAAGRLFGLPHLPVPFVPFPLPVKYRIHYGPPVALAANADPDDPQDVQQAAEATKLAVERLIAEGLQRRRSVFW